MTRPRKASFTRALLLRAITACALVSASVWTSACRDRGGAEVRITSPAEGDTVGTDVAIELSAQGIEIAPASEHRAGTAHHHLFVDRDLTPAGEKMPSGTTGLVHLGKGDSAFTIEGLPVGPHRVIAVLGDSAHVPLEPLAVDTVTFTVAPE